MGCFEKSPRFEEKLFTVNYISRVLNTAWENKQIFVSKEDNSQDITSTRNLNIGWAAVIILLASEIGVEIELVENKTGYKIEPNAVYNLIAEARRFLVLIGLN